MKNIYFRFVLLQKPKIDEDKEPDLDNAYDALLATFEADYQISLQFGAQRRMLVTVTEGSLQQVQLCFTKYFSQLSKYFPRCRRRCTPRPGASPTCRCAPPTPWAAWPDSASAWPWSASASVCKEYYLV